MLVAVVVSDVELANVVVIGSEVETVVLVAEIV